MKDQDFRFEGNSGGFYITTSGICATRVIKSHQWAHQVPGLAGNSPIILPPNLAVTVDEEMALGENGGVLTEVRRRKLERDSGVTIWSKMRFVVDFRNLLFGCDFDLSFSKGYSLMKFFNL